MPHEAFESRIRDPAPAFICEAAGRGRESERFTARLKNEVRPPASKTSLQHLRSLIPSGGEQLMAFYATHEGCVLYADTLSGAAGIELFRIADMQTQTDRMRVWQQMLGDEEDDAFLKSIIAIGESPQSGNYFAMPVNGPHVGKVFFVQHDDEDPQPFAETFDAFLSLICAAPAELLSKTLGCTTRYADGRTDTQWIPLQYIPKINPASLPSNHGDQRPHTTATRLDTGIIMILIAVGCMVRFMWVAGTAKHVPGDGAPDFEAMAKMGALALAFVILVVIGIWLSRSSSSRR